MSSLILTIRRLVFRPIAVNWHFFHGLLAFRLRHLSRARRHFRRVLDLDTDHFRARVLLGQIHFHFLEVPEGLEHLSYARRLDPVRFQRAGLDEYFQGYDLEWGNPREKKETPLVANFRYEPETNGLGLGESWEFDPHNGNGIAPESLAPETFSAHPNSRSRNRGIGDFTSAQEYGRFKDLPPITRDEIEEIDWNKVTSEVFD